MIGVSVNEDELEVVREFFELFKTPWEPIVSGRRYRVVLSTNDKIDHVSADVVILYGSGEDLRYHKVAVKPERVVGRLSVEGRHKSFPIYGEVSVFVAGNQQPVLQVQG